MIGENQETVVEMKTGRNRSTQPDPAPERDRVPDPDFELLESYLDRELTPAEVLRLESRLVVEPELSAALGRMSAEHAVRRVVWESMEPDDAAARSLSAAVAKSARRSDLRRLVMSFARVAGAVAACVVLFLAGFGVGRGQAAPQDTVDERDILPRVGGTTRPTGQAEELTFFHGMKDGQVRPTTTPVTTWVAGEARRVYHVPLTDEAGNVTAVQKFENLEEAQDFAAEVERWQARQEQIHNGKVVVKSSKF